MPTSQLLNVKDLTIVLKRDGIQIPLVKEIAFDILPGHILGLIGASGCGKSLTCLSIMGLLPSGISRINGSILFQGEALHMATENRLREIRSTRLGMILQNPMSCFNPVFTIRYHIQETLAAHNRLQMEDIERIHETLAEVGFEDPSHILSLYPFQMSGGMLQRVMIALALMMKVDLLIADEPTTDLDVVSQNRVLELLAAMRDKYGISILLVTHDLSVVAHLADKVMVMQSGEVVEQGTAKAIFSVSRHPYTWSLLKAHMSLYDHRLYQWQSALAPSKEKSIAAGQSKLSYR